jgi:hypothetical protein
MEYIKVIIVQWMEILAQRMLLEWWVLEEIRCSIFSRLQDG